MSFLSEMDRYLTIRRQLGADLSTDERILRRFVTFADREGAQHVSTSLVMRWLESLPSANPGTRATRFRVARQLPNGCTAWIPGTRHHPEDWCRSAFNVLTPISAVTSRSLRSLSMRECCLRSTACAA